MTLKILLAEDEEQLSRVYAAALTHKGFEVTQAFNGQEAVDCARNQVFDVMILDIMMPEKTGLEALREIRSAGNRTHAIMLTAMAELEDKVTGLDAGADDYLTKPISLKELLARMDSLSRRLNQFSGQILEAGSVKLDVFQQEISVKNAIRLAGKETKLMEFFILNKNKQLSTQEIFHHVWGRDKEGDVDLGYVYIYVSYLRQKLRAIHADIEIIGEDGGDYCLVEVGD